MLQEFDVWKPIAIKSSLSIYYVENKEIGMMISYVGLRGT